MWLERDYIRWNKILLNDIVILDKVIFVNRVSIK